MLGINPITLYTSEPYFYPSISSFFCTFLLWNTKSVFLRSPNYLLSKQPEVIFYLTYLVYCLLLCIISTLSTKYNIEFLNPVLTLSFSLTLLQLNVYTVFLMKFSCYLSKLENMHLVHSSRKAHEDKSHLNLHLSLSYFFL